MQVLNAECLVNAAGRSWNRVSSRAQNMQQLFIAYFIVVHFYQLVPGNEDNAVSNSVTYFMFKGPVCFTAVDV